MRQVDSIGWVWPPLAGRFGFARRIDLTHPDTLGQDLAEQGYPSYRAFQRADSLNTDGLEVVADYRHELVYQRPGAFPANLAHLFPARRTYPVYVANSTSHPKLLYGKDKHVFAVQEALDRAGRWRPIESQGPDFCGNGHWILKIRPRQMAVFLVDKYAGNFATMLRVRVQNGESRYVSAPFAGRISEGQFRLPLRDYEVLKRNLSAVDDFYYGAVPAVVDSIQLRY
ncbi:hypothetical protein IC235_17365 [Hymenobacter sp. BT664]|uniref:Uncharacterized protein n=1 Tax=Hymenobacter montanus TaxID=2771359 RepID=A0A927GKK7_9BACT|nr:hypothetical protein [Hymenobacter montanus]MBD2769662.1 hypothetical protein [Hymenobacter montanus]